MDLTTGYSISFPVFQAKAQEGGSFRSQGEIRGTAFALGQDFMLTAGHVVENMSMSNDDMAVVGMYAPELGIKGVRVIEHELLGCDLALLRVALDSPQLASVFYRFKWLAKSPPIFETVRAVGYAYGIHRIDDIQSCVVRGFQGHLVSELFEYRPVGASGDPFRVYEVSFAAPRGLSGAPLLNAAGTPHIFGVVIGNSNSRMLIFNSEERIEETGERLTVEQYESLQLGIAVHAAQVIGIRSRLLDSTVGEHLAKHDLLIE